MEIPDAVEGGDEGRVGIEELVILDPVVHGMGVVGISEAYAEVVDHNLLRAVVVEHEALVLLEVTGGAVLGAAAVVELLDDELVHILVFELLLQEADVLHCRGGEDLFGAIVVGDHHLPD